MLEHQKVASCRLAGSCQQLHALGAANPAASPAVFHSWWVIMMSMDACPCSPGNPLVQPHDVSHELYHAGTDSSAEQMMTYPELGAVEHVDSAIDAQTRQC